MKKTRLSLTAISLLSGCMSSRLDYSPPTNFVSQGANIKVIDKSRDAVWAAAVPALGKNFFVINNLDKESGLINISYAGDPLQYVDCGQINVTIPTIWGDRNQLFPGATESKSYQVMLPMAMQEYHRKMALEGRVNLIFEQVGENKTRITANTRYSLNKQISGNVIGGAYLGNRSDSITFNSGGHARFPSDDSSEGTLCTPTGKLERDILSAIE